LARWPARANHSIREYEATTFLPHVTSLTSGVQGASKMASWDIPKKRNAQMRKFALPNLIALSYASLLATTAAVSAADVTYERLLKPSRRTG
jgi:hypothetical protein